jgi:hypothetical protein
MTVNQAIGRMLQALGVSTGPSGFRLLYGTIELKDDVATLRARLPPRVAPDLHLISPRGRPLEKLNYPGVRKHLAPEEIAQMPPVHDSEPTPARPLTDPENEAYERALIESSEKAGLETTEQEVGDLIGQLPDYLRGSAQSCFAQIAAQKFPRVATNLFEAQLEVQLTTLRKLREGSEKKVTCHTLIRSDRNGSAEANLYLPVSIPEAMPADEVKDHILKLCGFSGGISAYFLINGGREITGKESFEQQFNGITQMLLIHRTGYYSVSELSYRLVLRSSPPTSFGCR